MEINDEFRPEVTGVIAHKMQMILFALVKNKEKIGKNSFNDLLSSYNSLKSMNKYIEAGE